MSTQEEQTQDIIRNLVARACGNGLQRYRLDLGQEAQVAALRAKKRWNPKKGAWSTYLSHSINNTFATFLNHEKRNAFVLVGNFTRPGRSDFHPFCRTGRGSGYMSYAELLLDLELSLEGQPDLQKIFQRIRDGKQVKLGELRRLRCQVEKILA